MGYTQYLFPRADFESKHWADIMAGTQRLVEICAKRGIVLRVEYDEPEAPSITKRKIVFNGLGEEGHETFVLLRRPEGRQFCKTARKPYDVAVTAMLAYVTSVYPYAMVVASDGGKKDWRKGVLLAREVWPGVNIQCPQTVK